MQKRRELEEQNQQLQKELQEERAKAQTLQGAQVTPCPSAHLQSKTFAALQVILRIHYVFIQQVS